MTQTFALPSWIQHTEPPAQSPCQGRFCHSFLIHPPAASAQPARPVTARTVRPEQPGVVLCTSNPFDAAGARPKLYKHSVRVTRLCTDNGEHPSRIRSWWFISIAVALAPVAHPPLPPEAPTAPGPSALFRPRQATAGIPAGPPKSWRLQPQAQAWGKFRGSHHFRPKKKRILQLCRVPRDPDAQRHPARPSVAQVARQPGCSCRPETAQQKQRHTRAPATGRSRRAQFHNDQAPDHSRWYVPNPPLHLACPWVLGVQDPRPLVAAKGPRSHAPGLACSTDATWLSASRL